MTSRRRAIRRRSGSRRSSSRRKAEPAEEPWRPRTNGAMPIALVLGAIVLGAKRGIAGARASDVKLPAAKTRR
jgi:hypothetical protein